MVINGVMSVTMSYFLASEAPLVEEDLKSLVLLSLNTGARRGELYRLQWKDINFDFKNLALVICGKRKSYTRHITLNKETYNTLLGRAYSQRM